MTTFDLAAKPAARHCSIGRRGSLRDRPPLHGSK